MHSPPTHKAGNLLDLVILRNCSSSDPTVTPLHQSDHHLISFSLPLAPLPPSPPSTPTVMVRRNLRSLSPSSLASSVTASLPPLESFSNLPTDSASSALSSSLSSALDSLCPLVSRPARSSPPSPWMSDPLRPNRASLRAAGRKWRKSMAQSDLSAYQSRLAAFSTAVTSAKINYQTKIHKSASNPHQLFSIFSSLLSTPLPPQSSLAADDFTVFFDEKIADIRSSFTSTATLPPLCSLPLFLHFLSPH
ncbi:uncharacterized protein LOC135251993 [Anguilla rostrata]|uniref:uncharacterized protein LOC135251993 n=1 Tax=Anguilla rostrata TaxID=7938 RepID=UPI0030D5CB3D